MVPPFAYLHLSKILIVMLIAISWRLLNKFCHKIAAVWTSETFSQLSRKIQVSPFSHPGTRFFCIHENMKAVVIYQLSGLFWNFLIWPSNCSTLIFLLLIQEICPHVSERVTIITKCFYKCNISLQTNRFYPMLEFGSLSQKYRKHESSYNHLAMQANIQFFSN